MTAKEAREIILQRGYEEIWLSLPEPIRFSIQEAVNNGEIACSVEASLLNGPARRKLQRLGYNIQHLTGSEYYITWIYL